LSLMGACLPSVFWVGSEALAASVTTGLAGKDGGVVLLDAAAGVPADGAGCFVLERAPAGELENEGQRKTYFFRGCGFACPFASRGVGLPPKGRGGGLFFDAGAGVGVVRRAWVVAGGALATDESRTTTFPATFFFGGWARG
jgi:hypothetical protein